MSSNAAGQEHAAARHSELAVAVHCANCGSSLVAAFCAECGQRTHRGRFRIRPLVTTAVDEVLRLDRGLLRTAVALTTSPGEMLRTYIGGRTRPYTDPLKYLLITLAAATLAYTATGVFRSLLPVSGDAAPTPAQALVLEFFTRYFNVVLAFGVPAMAFGSWLVFRRTRLNFAEHLIVNLYAYGQMCVLSVLLLPLLLLGGSPQLYVGVYSAVMMAYYVFVVRRFFDVGWISATFRGSIIMAIAYLAYVATTVVAILAVRPFM